MFNVCPVEKLVKLNHEQDGTREFKRKMRRIIKDLKVHTAGVTGNCAMDNKRKFMDETTKAIKSDVRDGIVKKFEKAYRHLERMVESKKEESKETRDSGDCKEFYEEAMFLCQSM